MEIKYHNHEIRNQKAKIVWLRMAEEYNRGDDPNEIIKRHINPKTKRPYTRAHLYWVLKQVQKL